MHPRAAEFGTRVEAEYDRTIELREFPDGTESVAESDRIGTETYRGGTR